MLHELNNSYIQHTRWGAGAAGEDCTCGGGQCPWQVQAHLAAGRHPGWPRPGKRRLLLARWTLAGGMGTGLQRSAMHCTPRRKDYRVLSGLRCWQACGQTRRDMDRTTHFFFADTAADCCSSLPTTQGLCCSCRPALELVRFLHPPPLLTQNNPLLTRPSTAAASRLASKQSLAHAAWYVAPSGLQVL